MQVNGNNYSNQQNFGMALKSSDVVNKALRTRITKPVDAQELSALVEQASKNDIVDIHLFADDKGKLRANVFTRESSFDNPNSFHVNLPLRPRLFWDHIPLDRITHLIAVIQRFGW